jgi:hypothetical protein
VVDEFTGRFWNQIFPQFSLHEGIVVRPNVAMVWAVRKGSPELLAALNPIIEANRAGRVFENTLLPKICASRRWLDTRRPTRSSQSSDRLQASSRSTQIGMVWITF